MRIPDKPHMWPHPYTSRRQGQSLQFRAKNPRSHVIIKYHETLRKHQLNMFWSFLRNSWKSGSRLKNPVLCSDFELCWKIPWNTQKTPTKHVLRLFKKFLKIRFSAQTSDSRLRCRTMLKIHWNTQKTPTKHFFRLFKKFLKIRFSAQTSDSRHRCRTMLKIHYNMTARIFGAKL